MRALRLILRATLTVLLVIGVGLTVVRVLGLDHGYPLVPLMTVYPYVVLGTAVATAGLAASRAWAEVVLGAVTLAVGLGVLAPRVLVGPAPAAAPGATSVVVAVANLRMGAGDAQAMAATLEHHGVDALVVLELTDAAIGRLEDAGVSRLLPHQELLPSRLTSGGGIYSRLPLTPRAPSSLRRFGATPRAILALTDGRQLALEAVHPLPPVDTAWVDDWARAIASLPEPSSGDVTTVLAGDLNATHDHSAFRELLGRGWVDAADARGAGLVPTFNALPFGEPVPPVTLDHVLVPADVGVERVAVEPLPRSDHRILVVELRLPDV